MEESRGVLLFNRGEKCVIRAIVALYSLRKYWKGDVTFFLEDPYPHEFDEVCKYFSVNTDRNFTLFMYLPPKVKRQG